MKFKKGKRNSLSFVFWNREIRKFYVVVLQWRQRNVPKSVPNRQSCYCFAQLNRLLVWRSRCRRLRKDWLCDAFSWCTVKSMIPRVTWFYLVWRVCIQRRVKSRVGYWRHSTRKHRISNSFHARRKWQHSSQTLLAGFQWACCFEMRIPSVFATLVNWFVFVALGYYVP